ncbi:hypothetical protein [Streptacidiphilus sp. PAMC 29251]
MTAPAAAAAQTRTRPCTGRRRRRIAPALARPLAMLDGGTLSGPGALEGLNGLDGLDDFAPFTGIPDDAGSCLPDLDATSGRGLFLIRALMDHVQFQNHPRSGAVVSFDKVLKFRDSPLLHAS